MPGEIASGSQQRKTPADKAGLIFLASQLTGARCFHAFPFYSVSLFRLNHSLFNDDIFLRWINMLHLQFFCRDTFNPAVIAEGVLF